MPLTIFESIMPADVSRTFAWHEAPGAFLRLTPPWEGVRVVSATGGIAKGARVHFKIRSGPLWLDWMAKHTGYDKDRMFSDQQVKGPFAKWKHTHLFEPEKEGCRLVDRLEWELPMAPLSNLVAGKMVQRKLDRMFAFRHQTTSQDLVLHARYSQKPLHILISGASGLLGSTLVPFLTTGGHRVTRLVRHKSQVGPDAAYWNPATGEAELGHLTDVDAVVHLAGENIGEGLWTAEKKRRVVQSRIDGTRLLVQALSQMKPMPRVLVSASAVGIYGDRKDDRLSDNDGVGEGFVAELCRQWEEQALAAADHGMRVVALRIGVVLTPAGGALGKMLPPARLGMGGHLGHGNQYVPWISPDDVLGAILHCLATETVQGPVNCTAPSPATSRELSQTLGRVLDKKAPFAVPEWALYPVFGQRTDELLLASAKAMPDKLESTGYEFLFPGLYHALGRVLGT